MSEVLPREERYSVWKEILIDIKNWFLDIFYYMPQRFYNRLRRVVEWLPIIWNNHDWDYHYLFIVMRYKLSRMEKCIREEGHASNSKETADKIKTAKLLLERLTEHEYLENSMINTYMKWGKFDFKLNTLKINWKNSLTTREKYYAKKSYKKSIKHANYMENQDIEYFFKFFKKHYKSFWD